MLCHRHSQHQCQFLLIFIFIQYCLLNSTLAQPQQHQPPYYSYSSYTQQQQQQQQQPYYYQPSSTTQFSNNHPIQTTTEQLPTTWQYPQPASASSSSSLYSTPRYSQASNTPNTYYYQQPYNAFNNVYQASEGSQPSSIYPSLQSFNPSPTLSSSSSSPSYNTLPTYARPPASTNLAPSFNPPLAPSPAAPSFNPPLAPSPLASSSSYTSSSIEQLASPTISYTPSNPSWPFVSADSHLAPQRQPERVPLPTPLLPLQATVTNEPSYPTRTVITPPIVTGVQRQSDGDTIRHIERAPRQNLVTALVDTLPSTTPTPASPTPSPSPRPFPNHVHFITKPSTTSSTTTTPYFSQNDLDEIATTLQLAPSLWTTPAPIRPSSLPPYIIDRRNKSTTTTTSTTTTSTAPLSTTKRVPVTRPTPQAPVAAPPVEPSNNLSDTLTGLTEAVKVVESPRVQPVGPPPFSSADIRSAQPTEEPSPTLEEVLATTTGEVFGEAHLIAQEEGFVMKGGVLPFIELEEEENVDENGHPKTTTEVPRTRAKTMQEAMDAYQESLKLDEPIVFPELGDGATPHAPNGIFAYCYPFTFDEIVTKCGEAKNNVNATGVYIPMMMEIQMKHDPQWYLKLKELKSRSKLDIVGIAYEKPDWDLITNILMENKGVFAGVMIEWIGPDSCVENIEPPTMNHLHLMEMATTKKILRYFVREQEFAKCNTTDPVFLSPQSGVSGTLPFPPMLEPVFSCFAGQEGLCFKAFNKHPKESCENKQRFSFNPYEQAGGRMMHLVNETCHGMPPHDLYGVL